MIIMMMILCHKDFKAREKTNVSWIANSPHKRKTNTIRLDPSDWENFPPTSDPSPMLVSVKRTVKTGVKNLVS